MTIEPLYAVLSAIAVLSILNSELFMILLAGFMAWLEFKRAYPVIYFLGCDFCKGFWLTLAACWLYGIIPLVLPCYGLLVIYLTIRDRND